MNIVALQDTPLAPGHPLADTVARLLEPIEGAAPGGADLRYEGTYDAIDEARRNENARLPQGVWQREVKQANWPQVERLCVEALGNRTKDLRIACWLAEAWIHRFGFRGLAPGLTLAEGLCRLFWHDLQPSIDGSDPATHIAAIDWLNQRLPIALRQVPIIVNASMPDTRFNWVDHLEAQRLEIIRGKDSAAAQRAEAGGSVTLAMIDAGQNRTCTDDLAELATDAAAGLAALAALDATLDACCGRDAPGLSKIRELVRDVADYAGSIVTARQALVLTARETPAPVAQGREVADEAPARAVPLFSNAIMSRSLAYRQLEAVAAFLRENEPHSPVSYVLEELVEWGRMPLAELDLALRERGSSVSLLIEAIGINYTEE